MATSSITKQALNLLRSEKPHSSITDLIGILTSPSYEPEAYDGIPELVESIRLQPTGPAEASRAIRKKLKHGDAHQQYRALVLLKATVENGGETFQTSFADGQLTDAIKHMVSDPGIDPKVKRKLVGVLMSWHKQFEGDPRMSLVANLYKSVPHVSTGKAAQPQESEYEKRKREEREAKVEAKRRTKEEKLKREEDMRRMAQQKKKRPPFDFEKEKPLILQTIAEASQAANNLVNALTLVNSDHESIQENSRVQECLENTKLVRKRVVRYIQLVENEELIGTLLDTNERIIAAFQTYDKFMQPTMTDKDVDEVQQHIAKVTIDNTGGTIDRLQEKQRAAVERHRAKGRDDPSVDQAYPSPPNSAALHPDLHELTFGEIGTSSRNLPPPLRPDGPDSGSDEYNAQGSLSDFSDYESSDEETRNRQGSSSKRSGSRPYAQSDDEVDARQDTRQGPAAEDDPFADPFADQQAVGTPELQKQGLHW